MAETQRRWKFRWTQDIWSRVPRNEKDNPTFGSLIEGQRFFMRLHAEELRNAGAQGMITENMEEWPEPLKKQLQGMANETLLRLVNTALYSLEYQQGFHRKKAMEQQAGRKEEQNAG